MTNTPQQPRYRTGIEADTLEAGREASPSLAAASSLVACTAAGLLRVAALLPPPSAEADASIQLGRGEGLRRAAHGEWLASAGTAGSGARGGSLCVAWTVPGRTRLSVPTRPFAERRIRRHPAKEQLCRVPRSGRQHSFFLKYLWRVHL